MGEVYRPRHRLDRTVAIFPRFASDPVRKQRFEREAKPFPASTIPGRVL
jgi:hypothetical protein